MTQYPFPPLTKDYPQYGPGQWGVLGADRALGARLDTRSNIFYVDSAHARASDSNDGTDPDNPLMTLTMGNTRATANNNDIIYVRQLTLALETFPIPLSKHRMHVLSVMYAPGKGPAITPVADTAGVLITGDHVEIAGFEINGGATHGAIEFSTTAQSWGADIHHNRFGWQSGAQDGIRMAGAVDKVQFMIHDNWFNDKITRDGIRIDQNSTRSEIWGNHFRMLDAAGVGINLVTLCTDIYAIHDNVFRVNGAVQGDAITCNVNSIGCMFWGNQAMDAGAAPAQNPYIDLGGNDWGLNWTGDVVTYPV
jgi:hypothetical protein